MDSCMHGANTSPLLLSYMSKTADGRMQVRPIHHVLKGHALSTVTISFVVFYVEFIKVSGFCHANARLCNSLDTFRCMFILVGSPFTCFPFEFVSLYQYKLQFSQISDSVYGLLAFQ